MATIYLIFSLLAGCFIVLQRNVNMELARNVGVSGSNLINYVVGSGFAAIIYLAAIYLGYIDTSNFGGFHFSLIIAALCGVTIVLLSNWLVPKATAITFTVFTLIGQCTSSIILDILLYKKEITATNLIGGAVVIIGVILYNYEND